MVVLVGQKFHMQAMIRNNYTAKRYSALKIFLQEQVAVLRDLTSQNSGDNFGKAIEINLETDDKNNLKIDGDYPDAGKISIDEQSKVKLAIWDDDVKKCATKNLTAKSVTINETITSESNCLNAFNSL